MQEFMIPSRCKLQGSHVWSGGLPQPEECQLRRIREIPNVGMKAGLHPQHPGEFEAKELLKTAVGKLATLIQVVIGMDAAAPRVSGLGRYDLDQVTR